MMETFNVGDQETCANCGEILNDYMVADGCDHCEDCFRHYEENGVHAPTQPAAPESAERAIGLQAIAWLDTIIGNRAVASDEQAKDIARLQAENAALKIELAELQADNEALRRNQAAQSNHISIADGLRKREAQQQDQLMRRDRTIRDTEKQALDAKRAYLETLAELQSLKAELENRQRTLDATSDEMIAARTNEERYRKVLSEIHTIAITSNGNEFSPPMNKISYAAHQALSGTDADDDE